MRYRSTLLCLLLCSSALVAQMPTGKVLGGLSLVSPLYGLDHNEVVINGVSHTDRGPMYGAFALWTNQRIAINNMLFFSDVNGTDIAGDVFFANYYHNPEASVTWNLGLGWVWHSIDSGDVTMPVEFPAQGPPVMGTVDSHINISAPLPKAGLLLRWPEKGVSLNPYLAWTEENINFADQRFSLDHEDRGMVYGITAKWNWRFLYSTLKYYYQTVDGSGDHYHVARVRNSVFLNHSFGFTTRLEYMEHSTSDDFSILFGPCILF